MKRQSIVLRIDNPTKWVWRIVQELYEGLCDGIESAALRDSDLWDELAKGDDAAAPMTITIAGLPQNDSVNLNGEWDVYEAIIEEASCGY